MARGHPNIKLWIRRAHLYAGLALLPWVLLYAVSGLLFNHPDWSAPPEAHQVFALSDLERATSQSPLLDAHAAATAVANALGEDVEVHSRPAPAMRRTLRATAPDDGRGPAEELSIRFPSRRGSWGARPSHAPRRPASLADVDALDLPDHDAAAWQRLADAVATDMVGDPTTVELLRTPTVRFHAQIDGERWQVDYDANSGDVEFEPLDGREVHLPRLLARLHRTHVYPDTFGMAWIHALLVDLSALCLVLWAVTGLFMWWQMRRVRRVGWVVMAGGAFVTLCILVEVVPPLLS